MGAWLLRCSAPSGAPPLHPHRRGTYPRIGYVDQPVSSDIGANALVGVDVGGSGIKAALVDCSRGEATGRIRVETPQPATPDAVAGTVASLVRQFDALGPIGCTLPAVVSHGVVRTATHIDRGWIGTNGEKLLSKATGRDCVVLNDADAAGVAEARFGAAKDRAGVVVVVTVGTGVGSALLVDGTLVPNSELGHLYVDGHLADTWVSDATRTKGNLSWKHWSSRFERYLQRLQDVVWPELIVVGGGIVKFADKFMDRLDIDCEVRIAALGNLAGIVGAAVVAADAPHGVTSDRS
jgi:polyphosphate glucokinase